MVGRRYSCGPSASSHSRGHQDELSQRSAESPLSGYPRIRARFAIEIMDLNSQAMLPQRQLLTAALPGCSHLRVPPGLQMKNGWTTAVPSPLSHDGLQNVLSNSDCGRSADPDLMRPLASSGSRSFRPGHLPAWVRARMSSIIEHVTIRANFQRPWRLTISRRKLVRERVSHD